MAEDTPPPLPSLFGPDLEALLLREGARLRAQGHVIQIILAIMANSHRPALEANLRSIRLDAQSARAEGREHSGLDAAAELLAAGLRPSSCEFPFIRLVTDDNPGHS